MALVERRDRQQRRPRASESGSNARRATAGCASTHDDDAPRDGDEHERSAAERHGRLDNVRSEPATGRCHAGLSGTKNPDVTNQHARRGPSEKQKYPDRQAG